MLFYFVRHGYTGPNHAAWGKQDGMRDNFKNDEEVPLEIKYGIPQVLETAQFMQKELEGKKILFLVSPYKRTVQTARYISNELDNYDYEEVNALREINAGMEYGITDNERKKMSDEYWEMAEKKHRYGEPYYHGESKSDVKRRMISLAARLRKLDQDNTENYDAVVVVAHNCVNNILLSMLTNNTEIAAQHTGGVISMDDPSKEIFTPKTFVPKDYRVNFNDYKVNSDGTIEYADIAKFRELLKENRNNPEFEKFFKGGDITPLNENSLRVEGTGSTLLLPPVACDDQQMVYIDCKIGKGNVSSDKKSTSTYFILDGIGEFYINEQKRKVKPGDIIVVKPGEKCYYEGTMHIIEKMEPRFEPENVTIFEEVEYENRNSRRR